MSGEWKSRRAFGVALTSVAVCYRTVLSGSFAQDQSATEHSLDDTMRVIGRGLASPTPADVLRAHEILGRAPVGPCHPLKVAKWFLTLDESDITETPNGPDYRANPIIVEFFRQATTLKDPAGDETWWCAAFVNWCLMRSQQERTRSALSSSFRQWHNIPEPSQPGDLVVYGDVADPRHGHVGFFLDFDVDQKIMTLGGNQRQNGRPMICVQSYPRQSRYMTLLSFHRDPAWPALSA